MEPADDDTDETRPTGPSEDRPDATLDDELRALTDAQRAGDAAAARRRERELRHQAAAGGTLAGVLRDLGERELAVTVSTTGGRTLAGAIRTVGADFVGLRTATGIAALVPLVVIDSIHVEPGARPTVGDRVVAVRASLAAVLDELAGSRTTLMLLTRGSEHVSGMLRSAGVDVVTVLAAEGTIYVPLAAVAVVTMP